MNHDPEGLRLFRPELELEAAFEEDLPPDPVSEAQARSSLHGKEFDFLAEQFLASAGGQVLERHLQVLGFPMDFLIEGDNGQRFYVDGHGTPDRTLRAQAGMRRTDTMLKFGFKVLCLKEAGCAYPVILLTSHLPSETSSAAFYLSKLSATLWDAIAITGDRAGFARLESYLRQVPALEQPIESGWRLGIQQRLVLGVEQERDDGRA